MTFSSLASISSIIIELGGNPRRLNKAIEVYRQHPDALILISSECCPELCVNMLKAGNVPEANYIFDFNAWDTVTNFTETYNFVRSKRAKKLFIVTDKFHMRRSIAIATVVYFLTGVELIPCESLEGDLSRTEPDAQVVNAFFRALAWKLFGRLNKNSNSYKTRMPDILKDKAKAQLIAPVT
jgi:hypothetical protein